MLTEVFVGPAVVVDHGVLHPDHKIARPVFWILEKVLPIPSLAVFVVRKVP